MHNTPTCHYFLEELCGWLLPLIGIFFSPTSTSSLLLTSPSLTSFLSPDFVSLSLTFSLKFSRFNHLFPLSRSLFRTPPRYPKSHLSLSPFQIFSIPLFFSIPSSSPSHFPSFTPFSSHQLSLPLPPFSPSLFLSQAPSNFLHPNPSLSILLSLPLYPSHRTSNFPISSPFSPTSHSTHHHSLKFAKPFLFLPPPSLCLSLTPISIILFSKFLK